MKRPGEDQDVNVPTPGNSDSDRVRRTLAMGGFDTRPRLTEATEGGNAVERVSAMFERLGLQGVLRENMAQALNKRAEKPVHEEPAVAEAA